MSSTIERERKNRRREFDAAVETAWAALIADAISDYDAVDAKEIAVWYEEWSRKFEHVPLPEHNEKSVS